MKTSLITAWLCLAVLFRAFSQSGQPSIYFKQDFCETEVPFQSASPGPGQVDYAIATSTAQLLNGNCYLDAIRTDPSNGGSIRIIRTTPLANPAPKTLHAYLELDVRDVTQEGTIAAYFAVGNGLISTHTLIPNASIFSKLALDFHPGGAYNFRITTASGPVLSSPLNGRVRLTWAMNNGAESFTYLSPQKTAVSLAPGKFAVWINEDLWISGAGAVSPVDLNNFAFILSNGAGTVRLHRIELSDNGFQLPLNLSRFKTERKLDEVQVYWTMEAGHTAAFFQIERSLNGYGFEPIGHVDVTDTEQRGYAFTDPSPANGLNYYRLKMIGSDGEIKYSPLSSISFDRSGPTATLAPNPALPDKITLLCSGFLPGQVALVCMSGHTYRTQNHYDTKTNLLTISPANPLPSGIYLLRFSAETALKTVKVVIP
ncbi:hypothetical protein GCM10023091_08230 [Ravibacter arvi]|uniref:T9SS type A sorting domain-containing protein n=1 Tax=Ravibacter arvi TaxID=2051041 RepID=A0ABP8LRF8_9BACT